MSRRARQLNREVAEAPLDSDKRVVNVASSIVMTPLTKSGPCSGKVGVDARGVKSKSTSGVWSSGTESVNAESCAECVAVLRGDLLRRTCEIGSTPKVVSSVSSSHLALQSVHSCASFCVLCSSGLFEYRY